MLGILPGLMQSQTGLLPARQSRFSAQILSDIQSASSPGQCSGNGDLPGLDLCFRRMRMDASRYSATSFKGDMFGGGDTGCSTAPLLRVKTVQD